MQTARSSEQERLFALPLILKLQIDGAPGAVVAIEVACSDVALVGKVAGVQLQRPVAVDLISRHQVEYRVGGYSFIGVIAFIKRRAVVAGAGRKSQVPRIGQHEAMAEPERGLVSGNQWSLYRFQCADVLSRPVVGIREPECRVFREVDIAL